MRRLRDYLDKHFSYSFRDFWKRDWEKTDKFMISSFALLALLTSFLAYNAYPKKQEPKQESIKIGYRTDLNHDGNLDFVLQDIATGKEENLYRKFVKDGGVWKEKYFSQECLKRLAEQNLNSKIREAGINQKKSVEKAKKEYENELRKYNLTGD